jgi:hypothetical protein
MGRWFKLQLKETLMTTDIDNEMPEEEQVEGEEVENEPAKTVSNKVVTNMKRLHGIKKLFPAKLAASKKAVEE